MSRTEFWSTTLAFYLQFILYSFLLNILYLYKCGLKKCLLTSKQNKLNKYIETQKEKFTQLDLQDVEVREKIKHCKSKNKKLQKQLEKDKEKVGPPAATHPHMIELH